MRVLSTRHMGPGSAVGLLREELDRQGISVQLITEQDGQTSVVRCVLRARDSSVLADSSGRGSGPQAQASALFEAWENHCHRAGFDEFRNDPDCLRLMPAKAVADQPALRNDALIHRLAAEFPDKQISCLRFEPISADGEALWYPAFARFPWFLQYPVPGEEIPYRPYLRYATNFGTAAGTSESEALLHALLEVIEGDAFSLALLDWSVSKDNVTRTVDPADLPRDLQELCGLIEHTAGRSPLICEITTDIGVPAYCALPSHSTYVGAGGAGAATTPGYAVERALGEFLQVHVTQCENPERQAQLRRMLDRLEPWPVLARCMVLDPAPISAASRTVPGRPPGWWDPVPITVEAQLDSVTQALTRVGMSGYYVRWNSAGSTVPVVTVLVPGLETFFLSRVGIPLLPTGRGIHKLASVAGGGR